MAQFSSIRDRNRENSGGGFRAPQEPVNSAGYAPGEGWGEHHNFSAPEAMMRVAETQAGAHRYGADREFQGEGVRADAQKYGADVGFKGHQYVADQERASRKETQPWQQTEAGVKFATGGIPGFKDPQQLANEQHGKNFDAHFKGTYGDIPKAGTPEYKDYYAARNAAVTGGGVEAGDKYHQQTQQFNKYKPLFTPDNLAAHGVTIPPAILQNPDLWRSTVARFGPELEKRMSQPAGGTGFVAADPAMNRISGAVNSFGRGAVQSAEMFNRGVRQVIPGSSAIINERGGFRNPLSP